MEKTASESYKQDKVSVIIPTYNRFQYLLNTIQSVKRQTYSNIEIIVVNDRSTQKEYYDFDWKKNNITIIHLEKNSKDVFGYPCPGGYQRNFGIKISTGKYIAFCDDDDIWLPNKIELQIKAMKKTGCKMSSTDGFVGNGVYDKTKFYEKHNAGFCYSSIKDEYIKKKSNLFDNGFPIIWNLEFLKINNGMICCSVIIEKEIIDKVGDFITTEVGFLRRVSVGNFHTKCVVYVHPDYNYWLRALKYTNSVYVKDCCVYYDNGHGDGRLY